MSWEEAFGLPCFVSCRVNEWGEAMGRPRIEMKSKRSKAVRLTIGSVCTVSLIPRSFNAEFASGTVVASTHGGGEQ